MFNHLDHLGCSEQNFLAMRLAVWFHDLYYDSQAPKGENEDQSCELVDVWFRELDDLRSLAEDDDQLIAKIKLYIQHTKTHQLTPVSATDHGNLLNGTSIARFLRADLAQFFNSPREYWQYLIQLRAEYSWVDDATWRRGRMRFLDEMLARTTLIPKMPHEVFDTYEQQARINLNNERVLLLENKSYLQWQF